MYIKPNQGIKIRDPLTRAFLPEEGTNVEESGFWLRRVRDGDVTVVRENQTAAVAVGSSTKKNRG